LEHAQGFYQFMRRMAGENPRNDFFFAIVLKSSGEVIGDAALNILNRNNGTAGGGIWINERCHGQGYGAEAFGARARFAFEGLGLRRLENGFFAGNEASRQMQLRLGYRIEGLRRKALLCLADGQYKDEYITGLLREEWIHERNHLQIKEQP